MIILKEDPKSLEISASLLNDGKIIIVPTDTVYGFSGIAPLTKEKLVAIKKRDVSKNFINLIAEPNDIYKYTYTKIPDFLYSLWPAPLSIIVKEKEGAETIAFRCPADPWLRQLIYKVGAPIYSTSVNYAGFPGLNDINKIIREFEDKISLIINDGNKTASSSTIVDLTDEKPFIVRQGDLYLDF